MHGILPLSTRAFNLCNIWEDTATEIRYNALSNISTDVQVTSTANY